MSDEDSTTPFVVGFNPVPMANQVAVLGSRLRRLALGELVVALVVVALAWWQRWHPIWWWVAVVVLVALLVLAAAFWRLVTARRHLSRIGAGSALEASPSALVMHGLDGHALHLAWGEVAAIRVAGIKVGAGPDLVVESTSGRVWSMPLSFLDALPGTIDAGVRACSAGKVGVDLGSLDSLF